MLALIAALHAEQKMTVLMATHDPLDAERLCKTMIFVEDGIISATGTTGAFVSGTASEAFNRYIAHAGKSIKLQEMDSPFAAYTLDRAPDGT